MTTAQTVYRSSAPEVLEVQRDWKQGAEKFMDFVTEIEAEVGRDALFTRAGISGQIVVGFRAEEGDQEMPPDGLRFDRTRRFLVPHQSTTLGKKFVKRFKDSANARAKFPGMPPEVFDTNTMKMFAHGSEEIDGAVYITWGCEEKVLPATLIDDDMWQRVPLSEWYALKGL